MFALGGCTQILGLDEPTAVTGRYATRAIRNGTDKLPVLETVPRELDIAMLRLDGELPRPVDLDASGRLAFILGNAGDPYRIAMTRDGTTLEYQLAAPALDLTPPSFGRSDRAKVPMSTGIGYEITGTVTSQYSMVATTGVWASGDRGNTGTNTNFVVDWTSANPLSNPIGMIDFGLGDRTYMLIFDRNAGTTQTHIIIKQYREDDVKLTAGVVTSFMGPVMNISPTDCAHVKVPLLAENTRLMATGLPAAIQKTWDVLALPAPVLGPEGLLVARANTANLTADPDVMSMIANPFPGHTLGVRMVVVADFDIAYPGASAIKMPVQSTHVVAPPSACSSPTAFTKFVGVPDDFKLAGTAPGMVTLDRSRDPVLSWSMKMGTADRYTIAIREVLGVPDGAGGTTTDLGPLAPTVYITTDKSATIDLARLVMGKSYVFVVIAEEGFPDIAKGDLYASSLPFGRILAWSDVFTIAN